MSYIELPQYGDSYITSPVLNAGDLPIGEALGTIGLVTSEGLLYWFNGTSWEIVTSPIDPSAASDTDSIDLTVTSGVLSADLNLSAELPDSGYQEVELGIEPAPNQGLRAQIADSAIQSVFTATAPLDYDGSGDFSLMLSLSGADSDYQVVELITDNIDDGLRAQIADADIRSVLSATAPLSYNSTTGDFSISQADTNTDGYLSSADWNTFNDKEPAITAGTTDQYWRGDKTWQTLNVAALLPETSGTAASAGRIGEIISSSVNSATSSGVAATGDWGAVTSISLTAGVWQVQGVVGFTENGANLTTALECGVSASATGAGIGEFDTSVAPFLVSSTSDALLPTPIQYVNISSTTSYYLNSRFYYTAGSPQHRGRIIAIRIR